MDKAISDLVQELENLKQLEVLSTFPNQSNCCINNCVDFNSTSGFTVTYGDISTSDGKLVVACRDYASTQLKAKLNKSTILNQEKNILVKLRIKAVEGSNCGVGIHIGLTDGTTIPVTNSSIIGSNIAGYSLSNGEWKDLWWVFGAEVDTEIESVVFNIFTYATVEISSLQAFYSLDKNGSSIGDLGDSQVVSVVYNVDKATQPSTPVTAEEVEI